ncbi:MAG: hypothetical protein JKY37_27300 [Nannocystaceae bacterium]|nr:hypothetical protein [Nannocystaceae bacterium]
MTIASSQVLFAAGPDVLRFDVASDDLESVALHQSVPGAPVMLDGALYWINAGSGILAGSLVRQGPGEAAQEVMDRIGYPKAIESDGGQIYFVASEVLIGDELVSGALLAVDGGGVVDVLAGGLRQPADMAVTADRVVWIEQVGDDGSYPGAVRSIAKSGGPIQTITTIEDGLGVFLVADESEVFFTVYDSAQSRVHRVPLSGGESELVVAQIGGTVLDVAVTDEAIFVSAVWVDERLDSGSASLTRLCR